MDVLIADSLGAGAVIGARLSGTGSLVTFLDDRRRAFTLDFRRLKVSSELGDFDGYVHHLEAAEISRAYGLVIVAAEAHRVTEFLEALPFAINGSTTVLVLSPGLETFERVRGICKGATVLNGAHSVAAFMGDTSNIVHLGRGNTIVIEASNDDEKLRADRAVARLSCAGFTVRFVTSAQQCRWEATIRSVAAGGLAALLQCSLADVAVSGSDRQTLLWSLLQEGADIAAASGYAVSIGGLASFVERLPSMRAGALSGLGRRIERRSLGEVAELAAQLQRAARRANVASPMLDMVSAFLATRAAAARAAGVSEPPELPRPKAPIHRRDGWFSRTWAQRKSGGDR
ncbi:MAG: ketopantoate reductase family protein [Proteobacteria bacterium]|nr:ketopantoate reductase family protein [Pseudomonadota bacterium]